MAETRDGQVVAGPAGPPGAPPTPPPFLVGRQAVLADLQACLAQAQRGARQPLFVTGEAGIGKTTLVRQFLDHPPRRAGLGRTRAVHRAGGTRRGVSAAARSPGPPGASTWRRAAGCRPAPGGADLARAPPMLVEAREVEALQRQVQGASRDRMLRELADALTLVTTHTVLVLVLEDLQWSDAATVEWLAYLARRPERLRLLVLGTYRPSEVIARGHPLRQVVPELVAHGLGQDLGLELLTAAEVQAYVARRLGASPVTAELGADPPAHGRQCVVHGACARLSAAAGVGGPGGGPVGLRGGATTVEAQVPTSLRSLILTQVEALAPDAQACLAVASVAGVHFTAAEVAEGLQRAVEDVETVCDRLSQAGQFPAAQALETWPDGTVTARYAFQHALYQHVVYARVGSARRRRLHQRLGNGWRRAMAPRQGRSRPSSPSTSSAAARSRAPCTLCSRQGQMRSGAMPLTKRSSSSPKG